LRAALNGEVIAPMRFPLVTIRLVIFMLLMAGRGSAAPDVLVLVMPQAGGGGSGPVLAGLKAESTFFPNCIGSVAEVATAAALLTGRHEFECGIVDAGGGRNLLRPGVGTMPQAFLAAGYQTAVIGKWHFGENLPSRPQDLGFGSIFVHAGAGFGSTSDRWGNSAKDPWMRRAEGWKRETGSPPAVMVAEALRLVAGRAAAAAEPLFLWLAPEPAPDGMAELDAELGKLFAALERETVVLCIAARGGPPLRTPCFVRWPGKIAAGKTVTTQVSVSDWFATLAGLAGIDGGAGGGIDLSAALRGEGEFPDGRILISHPGAWPAADSAERHRSVGFEVRAGPWLLQGLDLFNTSADPACERNVFEEQADEAARLLMAYGQWWERVRPGLREPVRVVVGDPRQATVKLSAADWWPSREAPGAVSAMGMSTQKAVRRNLVALAEGAPPVPETAGHFKLLVARDGHYLVRLSKLPAEAESDDQRKLGVLKAGTVHLRAGKREVRGALQENMTAATLGVDLAAGEIDVEAWFTGQLGGDRILGALFVTITRAGDRKMPDFALELESLPGK
jgi:hypothetical protein